MVEKRRRANPTWIPLERNVFQHPKTLELARLLGKSKQQVVIHLLYFWFWCTESADGPEGYLPGVRPEHIAEVAGWRGDAQKFYRGLVNAGFIDEFESGPPCVHNWAKRYGRVLTAQAKTRERVAEHRSFQKLQGQLEMDGFDVTATSPLPNSDVAATSPLTTHMIEENRRGENSTTHAAAQPDGIPHEDGGAKKGEARPRRKQPYAEQFVALCEITGVNPETKNDLQRKKVSVAAAALGHDGVTGDQIRCFPAAWKRLYPNARPSAVAYASHADELLAEWSQGTSQGEVPTLTADQLAEDEAAREAERQERAASGMPTTPAEWAAFHDAQRKGETWELRRQP